MKRFARALVVVLGLAVIGSVVSLVPQRKAAAQSGPTVTIGSPLPLPVTGNVDATVNGTVAAQQSGNWNIGLTGTPTVSVGNFPSTLTGASVPISFKQSANFKTLVSTGTSYNEVFPDGTTSSGVFTIPQGEQFVITDVSWYMACSFLGCTTVVPSPGDAAVFLLGSGNIYLSVDTFRNSLVGPIASHADHLTSGIVMTQLPTPSIFGGGTTGEVFQVILQGYLVP